jgi:hypothetical protein
LPPLRECRSKSIERRVVLVGAAKVHAPNSPRGPVPELFESTHSPPLTEPFEGQLWRPVKVLAPE